MRSYLIGICLCVLSTPALAAEFTVTTPAFADGGTVPMTQVFNNGGCTGANQSPALTWSGAPAATESYAVTMYDPDAPTGSGWWHWTVFNIPATVHSLPAGAGAAGSTLLPAGAVNGRTDFGFSNYGGPCPPVGDAPHHYQITVFALKTATLPLDAQASGAMVGFMLHFNSLATARVTGQYGRAQ